MERAPKGCMCHLKTCVRDVDKEEISGTSKCQVGCYSVSFIHIYSRFEINLVLYSELEGPVLVAWW